VSKTIIHQGIPNHFEINFEDDEFVGTISYINKEEDSG
jgi:hypothetical protein